MQNLHVQDFTPEPPRETFLLHGKSKKKQQNFQSFFFGKSTLCYCRITQNHLHGYFIFYHYQTLISRKNGPIRENASS